jgi:hypothetical protein
MKLGTKRISAFMLVCSVGAIVSGIGIRELDEVGANSGESYRFDLVWLNLVQEASNDLLYVSRSLRDAILASSAEQRAAFLADSEKNLALARENLDKSRQTIASEKGTEAFAELDRS